MKLGQRQQGFTILELLIATTVFSVILLLAATAMIQVGRIYYKGNESTRVQEVTREIVDQIAKDIQFSGEQVIGTMQAMNDDGLFGGPLTEASNQNATWGTNFQDYQWRTFCVGKKRHLIVLNRSLDTSFDPTNPAHLSDPFKWGQGLMVYNDPGAMVGPNHYPGCPTPYQTDLSDPSKLPTPPHTFKELLSPGMMISKLDVIDNGSNLWEISVKVINTDSIDFIEVKNDPTLPFTIPVDPANPTGPQRTNPERVWRCKTDRHSSQFCAESELTTVVKRMVQ